MNAWSWFRRNVVERKLTLSRYASAPVSVNLTVVVILLPMLVLIQGAAIGALSTVLLTVLVICHELGHAVACRRLDVEVVEINVGFPYGYCAYDSSELDRHRDGVIAWGGVLAQATVLVTVLICLRALTGDFGAPGRNRDGFPLADTIWHALVGANAVLIVVNLLPLPGLDGWWAWPVLPRLVANARSRTNGRGKAEPVSRPDAPRDRVPHASDEVDDRSRAVVDEFLDRARKDRER